MKVLECHSKGDKRFSALYARVSVFGKEDSIENHYQFSKRIYGSPKPTNWKDLKGKNFDFFEINNRLYPKEYISDFYTLLWIKYFDKNPELLSYASTFDEFNDIFKSKNSMNCQADVINKIVKKGRNSVMQDCQEFLKLLTSKSNVLTLEKDLLSSKQNIIGHQVNCKGVMGSGLALQIKDKHPVVYSEYKKFYNANEPSDLLGKCQIVDIGNNKFVANLFGQFSYGRNSLFTNYEKLEESIRELKEFCTSFGLSVALPYNLGCGLAGGEWDVVEDIITKVFNDYPIILYKK